MIILVTGGCGFIGSALIRYLLANTKASIINLDKLSYAANPQALAHVAQSTRYQFIQGDICDAALLQQIFLQHQPDAVMHLAAESHVDRSINAAAAFITSNITGSFVLLEQARHYWQQLSTGAQQRFRFLHVSTDEVYGDLACSSAAPFTEQSCYAPSSPYAASKAASDHLARAWHRTYGLPVIISHSSNNYGPWQHAEKLIPNTIHKALSGQSIPVYGNGRQIRDWLYVEDHAQALYKVLTEGVVGETYNIGGNNEQQNIEVVKTICAILEELAPIKNSTLNIENYESLITHVTDRPGHDVRYAIDTSKIARELGWQPQQTFETGLRDTVQWYLQQNGALNMGS